jgi:hypothetical protein
MARPLIRRRITVTGRQRTDIDADLLTQALIQIAEDDATPTSPDKPIGRNRPPTVATPAPSPRRPAGRTSNQSAPPSQPRRTTQGAARRSHEHRT